MKDIPIIFSEPMIRALLDGRKTMTRREAWKLPRVSPDFPGKPSRWQSAKVGDRLWVQEAWRTHRDHDDIAPRLLLDGQRVVVTSMCADGDTEDWLGRPRPSIHMPRWASRLTLIVTATKIDRLRMMSDNDAISEGIERVPDGNHWTHMPFNRFTAKASFRDLWKSHHGPGAWDADPEVVAISFLVIKANIDAITKPLPAKDRDK